MAALRKKETQETYLKLLKSNKSKGDTLECSLCTKSSIETFDHFRIVKNDYPYDRIASVHDMLASKRHVKEDQFNDDERAEYAKLKAGYVNDNYEFIMESVVKGKTVPEHFHTQLIIIKEEE